MEAWETARAALSASSYASGVADYASVIGGEGIGGSRTDGAPDMSYLASSKVNTAAARDALAVMVGLIERAE